MTLSPSLIAPLAGVGVGLLLGALARRNHLCSLNAIERHFYGADSTQARTWVLAAAVTLLVTQLLLAGGAVQAEQIPLLNAALSIPMVLLGALMFGFGMSLVGTCAFGSLVRLGGGSLRSLVVVMVIGLSALATQHGLLSLLRMSLEQASTVLNDTATPNSLPHRFAAWSDSGAVGYGVVCLLVLIPMLWWTVFADPTYRQQRRYWGSAILAGVLVPMGLWITSALGAHSFEPIRVEGASFIHPLLEGMLLLSMGVGGWPGYGVGLALGVVMGAAAVAWLADDVRWEACDSAGELSRHLLGAVLMGVGGVLALGCTIGQGISGVGLLAMSTPIAVGGILLGAWSGLHLMIHGWPWRRGAYSAR